MTSYGQKAVNTCAFFKAELFTKRCTTTKTSYESAHSARPNDGNCKVFRCKAFIHVPAQKREGKFSAQAKEGILFGYCKNDVYQIFPSAENTVVKTKDVHVDKNSERKATREEPKLLEFDMSDDNIVFGDLS